MPSPTSSDRPHILLITSEDNGPELSCYGQRACKPRASTPLLPREPGLNTPTSPRPCAVPVAPASGLYPHLNGQIGLATHRFSMFCELHVLPDPDTLARFVDEHRRAGKLEGGHKSTAFRWQYLDYLARTKV